MWSFKKKSSADEPLTLKQRVEGFWEWYESNAERFFATIEARKCSDLATEVSEGVRLWLPGMAWAFGPEENMLFDGEASLEILRRVLRGKNLPEGTAIHYFTDDKADRVIPV